MVKKKTHLLVVINIGIGYLREKKTLKKIDK